MFCLKVSTDDAWVDVAVRERDVVLVDHAHCEVKAATNALSLATRHPEDSFIVRALAQVAREETEHFDRVIELMTRRGLSLGSPPVDTYAKELRTAAAKTRDPRVSPLIDRLVVAALIEARSCERFKRLAEAFAGVDGDLHALYKEFFIAEARHYPLYVSLAERAAGTDKPYVERRVETLSEAEAEIVVRLQRDLSRATIHG